MEIQHERMARPPRERVLLAAASLENAPVGEDIQAAYLALRTALWELIEVAEDPDDYMIVWNTVAKYAWADLLEYQETGNTDALERLQDKVAQAVGTL